MKIMNIFYGAEGKINQSELHLSVQIKVILVGIYHKHFKAPLSTTFPHFSIS